MLSKLKPQAISATAAATMILNAVFPTSSSFASEPASKEPAKSEVRGDLIRSGEIITIPGLIEVLPANGTIMKLVKSHYRTSDYQETVARKNTVLKDNGLSEETAKKLQPGANIFLRYTAEESQFAEGIPPKNHRIQMYYITPNPMTFNQILEKVYGNSLNNKTIKDALKMTGLKLEQLIPAGKQIQVPHRSIDRVDDQTDKTTPEPKTTPTKEPSRRSTPPKKKRKTMMAATQLPALTTNTSDIS